MFWDMKIRRATLWVCLWHFASFHVRSDSGVEVHSGTLYVLAFGLASFSRVDHSVNWNVASVHFSWTDRSCARRLQRHMQLFLHAFRHLVHHTLCLQLCTACKQARVQWWLFRIYPHHTSWSYQGLLCLPIPTTSQGCGTGHTPVFLLFRFGPLGVFVDLRNTVSSWNVRGCQYISNRPFMWY